jgi:hypothetical protein
MLTEKSSWENGLKVKLKVRGGSQVALGTR